MNRKTLVSMMVGASVASAGAMVPQQAQADWGNLDVKGMMRAEVALSLDGDGNPNNRRGMDSSSSTMNMIASRLELDFTWRKNDNWSGFAKIRGWADVTTLVDQGYENDSADLFAGASFDGDSTLLEQSGKYHIIDLAVGYIDYANGPIWVRVGKQQIAWGESFGFRTLDMVNSLDLRRHLVFDVQGEEFADERIATLGIRGSYSPPEWNGWEVEGFVTQFTPTLFAPQGSPYSNVDSGIFLQDAGDIDNARQRLVYGGRARGPLFNTGVEVQLNFVSRPQQVGVFEFKDGNLMDQGKFGGLGLLTRDTSAVVAAGTTNIPVGVGALAVLDPGYVAAGGGYIAGGTALGTFGAPIGFDGTPLVANSYNSATDPTFVDGSGTTHFGASIYNIVRTTFGGGAAAFDTAVTAAAVTGQDARNFAFSNATAGNILQYEAENDAWWSEMNQIIAHNGPAPFSANGGGLFWQFVGDQSNAGLVPWNNQQNFRLYNPNGGTGLNPDLVSGGSVEGGPVASFLAAAAEVAAGVNSNQALAVANGGNGYIDESDFTRVVNRGQGSVPMVKQVLAQEWKTPDYAQCTGGLPGTSNLSWGAPKYQTAATVGGGASNPFTSNYAVGEAYRNENGSNVSCDQLQLAHGTYLNGTMGIGTARSGYDNFLALIQAGGNVTRKFPRINIIGTGFNYMFQVPPDNPFNYVFDGLLFKGEASWAFNKEFTNNLSRNHHKADEQNWSFLVEKFHKFTYDLPAMYMVVQFNHRSESNGFDQYSSGIGDNGYNLIAAGGQQQYMQNRLRFDMAGAYDFASNGGGWFIQPGVRFKPYEQLQLDLYWNHFEGNDDNAFSSIDRNDEVFTRISRFF